MKRKLVSRRLARFTPAMIDARRRMSQLEPAVNACKTLRHAVELRAWNGDRDYTEYDKLIPPCGASCSCEAHHNAHSQMGAEFMRLGIRPWDTEGETVFADLLAELDRLVAGAGSVGRAG